MTTKKPDKTTAGRKLERGRFARMLAGGYTIEVTPTAKSKAGRRTTAKPPTDTRSRKS